MADRAVSIVDDIPKPSQSSVPRCSLRAAAPRAVIANQAVRNIPTNLDRICAELVELRKGADALAIRMSKAHETLRELNATHKKLRDILESIKDRSPRGSLEASLSNHWAIPSDHDAFSTSHFPSDTLPKEQRDPIALDDDSQYLSTALGLTDWSDIPPRHGYHPTVSTSPQVRTHAYKPT